MSEKYAELGYGTLLIHAQRVNKNMNANNIEEVVVDLLTSIMHLSQEGYHFNIEYLLLQAKDRFEEESSRQINEVIKSDNAPHVVRI